METALFYFFAASILLGGIGVVVQSNVLYAALSLMASLGATAGLFILMHAEFVAAAQVLVYIGGVVIFIVFAILLTVRLGEKKPRYSAQALVAAAVFMVITCGILTFNALNVTTRAADTGSIGLREIGVRLLSKDPNGFIVPFEIISILLLAIAIGSIAVARGRGSAGDKQ